MDERRMVLCLFFPSSKLSHTHTYTSIRHARWLFTFSYWSFFYDFSTFFNCHNLIARYVHIKINECKHKHNRTTAHIFSLQSTHTHQIHFASLSISLLVECVRVCVCQVRVCACSLFVSFGTFAIILPQNREEKNTFSALTIFSQTI